jgi:hypothetical protein
VAKAKAYNSTACSSCYGVGSTPAGIDAAGCTACATNSSLSLAARGGCSACYDKAVPAANKKPCLMCLTQKGISNAGVDPGCSVHVWR